MNGFYVRMADHFWADRLTQLKKNHVQITFLLQTSSRILKINNSDPLLHRAHCSPAFKTVPASAWIPKEAAI